MPITLVADVRLQCSYSCWDHIGLIAELMRRQKPYKFSQLAEISSNPDGGRQTGRLAAVPTSGAAMKKAEQPLTCAADGAETHLWSDMEVQILEAARHLIADEGYHNFTMRGIAKNSGIHLKSLQYHFRTKQEMLSAVVNYTIEKYYFQPYGKLFAEKSAGTPSERFSVMLDYLIDDLSNEFTARLFPELWALGSHDKDVADALDVFYCRHVESITTMVERINPALTRRAATHRAAMIAMMIEGLLLILGHGKPKHPKYANLRSSVKDTIFQIIMGPASERLAVQMAPPPAKSRRMQKHTS